MSQLTKCDNCGRILASREPHYTVFTHGDNEVPDPPRVHSSVRTTRIAVIEGDFCSFTCISEDQQKSESRRISLQLASQR